MLELGAGCAQRGDGVARRVAQLGRVFEAPAMGRSVTRLVEALLIGGCLVAAPFSVSTFDRFQIIAESALSSLG